MHSSTQATNQPVVIFYSQFMYEIAPHTFRCLHLKKRNSDNVCMDRNCSTLLMKYWIRAAVSPHLIISVLLLISHSFYDVSTFSSANCRIFNFSREKPTNRKVKEKNKKNHNIQGQQDFYRSQSTSRSVVDGNISHTQEVK